MNPLRVSVRLAAAGAALLAASGVAGVSPKVAQAASQPVLNWTRQMPATHPSARLRAAIAYDAATGDVVLFGGTGGRGILGDTWIWHGSTWTQQAPATSPPGLEDAAMTYDAATGNMVLFGGFNANLGGDLADTWVWDGSTWAQQHPAKSPPARTNFSIAYDAAAGNVVLFGGTGPHGYLPGTWVWAFPSGAEFR
jgi:hypothetical protein